MKKIVILSGGDGQEREIAIKSARFFKKYLEKDFDYYELPEQLDDFLLNKDKYSLAIPVFHGQYGEDGRIFAFLDILKIPHTFSSYDVHALCLNKTKTNSLANKIGLYTAKEYIYTGTSEIDSFPLIIKPNNGGSSFHTYKVNNDEELNKAAGKIKSDLDDDILVQEFIEGTEYSVSVVAGKTLPIMMLEKDKTDFFDYEAKYDNESGAKEVWPEIELGLKQELENTTLKVWGYFECKGYARVDYIVRDGKLYFLEINTIPGMTEGSILPQSWQKTGKSFQELIGEIKKNSE